MFLTQIYPNGFTVLHSKNVEGWRVRAVRLGDAGGCVCVCVRADRLCHGRKSLSLHVWRVWSVPIPGRAP